MRRKKKSISKEIRVGTVIGLAIIIIVSTVFAIGGQRKMFGEKVSYKILFESTSGLYEGDPVLLTGVEVGNVLSVSFPRDIMEKRILVEVEVLKDVSPRIRQDTKAKVAAASLVYGKVVSLSMGSQDQPDLLPGSYITADKGMDFTSIVSNTDTAITDVRDILAKIDKGDGLAGLLINGSPEMKGMLTNLSVSSKRLADILTRMESGQGTAGALLSNSESFKKTLADFQLSVADLQIMTGNLKGKKSIAGKLINDKVYGDEVMKDLKLTMRSLASITAKIDTGHGSIGSLINDRDLYVGLQDIVLGVQNSKLTKWLIQNRRKAGEKERKKIEKSGK